MPADKFSFTDSVTSPARECFGVIPSDTEVLSRVPKAIYVGSTGDIALRLVDDEADTTFRNVPSGSLLPVRPSAIRATGTSAGEIVGLV